MPLSTTPTGALNIDVLDTIALAGAEISAFDAASKRIFVTSSVGLQIVDATNPANLTLVTTVNFTALGFSSTDITSVAAKNGIIAVALPDPIKTNPGKVVFLDANGALLGSTTVGALPDMLTFTPDGTKVLVANEGEIDVSGADAEGSVSIIDITNIAAPVVTAAGFTSFNGQEAALRDEGVRIFPGKTVAQDVEPEYIAISPDGMKAFVTLQEANAIGILDIATATFTDIVPLGLKDYSTLLADFSDRDSATNGTATELKTGTPVFGMYMPDAIATFQAAGQTYYVIANEGDDRDDFLTPDETIRVNAAGYDLDNTLFTNEGTAGTASVAGTGLKGNDLIGRLTVSNVGAGSTDANITQLRGDTNGDGDIDQIMAYGGRSFSILDSTGAMVFDSADIIERITATIPGAFDDTRSDNKAAEPEGVTVGVVGGKTYAFVTLERANGVLTFDITNPDNVSFTGYNANTGDVSPEGILFVNGAASPNGGDLMIVSNEVSNTLSVYSVEQPFTLQLLHYYGESGLLGVDTAPIMGAMIDRFDDQYANTLVLGEGDSFIPGPWLVAGADPSLNSIAGIGSTALGRPDIAIMNAFGTDASALGNHEFDLGSPVLQGAIAASGAWAGALFPHITTNLNFAGDSSLRGLADATLGGTGTNAFAGQEASSIKGKIAPYAIVTQGTEKIGLVGATTWDLLSKTSPNGTVPKDDANIATSDLQEVAAYLQASITALQGLGVNKIVMLDQLDTLDRNKDLAGLVSGIDIMIAGGGHERMGDATDTAVAFPGHDANFIADAYPITTVGADGKPVLIVTSDTEYSYLGRLVVNFDSAGVIDVGSLNTSINGAYASNEATLQAAYGTTDTAAQIIATSTIATQVNTIVTAIDGIVAAKDGNIFGYTGVYLEGDRVYGRTQEVNFGNISADANREAAAEALAGQPFVVSLKNGGGIRASIGSIDAGGNKIPPAASDVKPAGGISQLDIENALRFDNKLMVFDTSAQGLLNIFNFAAGLSSGPNQQSGGFPQVGGIRFSYDPDSPAGSKIQSISLIDGAGQVIARIVENGVVVADAPSVISVVTLNFTANGGDGYPIKANAENFRYLLNDGTTSAAISEALDFTAVANVPANALGEQKAFQDYLLENFATPATAYNVADTTSALDMRIENLNFRSDAVFQGKTAVGDANNNFLDGSAGNDSLSGLGNPDGLNGFDANDTLDGGAGADGLTGGKGNDVYFVDTYLDTLIENANEGIDTVNSTDHHIMFSNFENLNLTGNNASEAIANDLANVITGNGQRNAIAGAGGNDTIDGGDGDDILDGGLGGDSMLGGTGIDTYYVDDAGDQVVETVAGPGLFDTVWSSIATYTLPTNVEIYIAISGAGNIGGIGNDDITLMLGNEAGNNLASLAGNDMVLGLDGNDTIDGGLGDLDIISGGVGNDSLTGGGGHDFFNYELITHGGDVITDFATLAGVEDDILDFRPMFPSFTNTAGISTVAQAVVSGHLTYTQAGADTLVFADADGGANNNVLMATLLNTVAANVQTYTLI